jgi:hypothetical protein
LKAFKEKNATSKYKLRSGNKGASGKQRILTLFVFLGADLTGHKKF